MLTKELLKRIKAKLAEDNRPWREAAQAKRKALEATGPGITPEEWQAILELYNYRCCYCGITGKLTKDHKFPLSKGGDHAPYNIVPACSKCNDKKGNKLGWKPRIFPFLRMETGKLKFDKLVCEG